MSRSLRLRPCAFLSAVACFSFGIRHGYETSTKVRISNKGFVQLGSATDHYLSVSAVKVSNARRPAMEETVHSTKSDTSQLNVTSENPIAMIENKTCGPISIYNCLQFCPGKNFKRSHLWVLVAKARKELVYSGKNETSADELEKVLKDIGFDPVSTIGGDEIKNELGSCNYQTMFLWLIPIRKMRSGGLQLHWVAVIKNGENDEPPVDQSPMAWAAQWVVYDPWDDSIRDPHLDTYERYFGPKGRGDPNPDNWGKKKLKSFKLSDYITRERKHMLKGDVRNVRITVRIDCETRTKPLPTHSLSSCCSIS